MLFPVISLLFSPSNMTKKKRMSSVNHISYFAVVTHDSAWLPIFHIIHLRASEKTFAYPLNEICPGKVEAVSSQKDKINKVPHNITLLRTTTKDFIRPSCPNKSDAFSFLEVEGHRKEVSLPFFFHLCNKEEPLFTHPCSNFQQPKPGKFRPTLSVLLNTDKGMNPFSFSLVETIAQVDNLVLWN